MALDGLGRPYGDRQRLAQDRAEPAAAPDRDDHEGHGELDHRDRPPRRQQAAGGRWRRPATPLAGHQPGDLGCAPKTFMPKAALPSAGQLGVGDPAADQLDRHPVARWRPAGRHGRGRGRVAGESAGPVGDVAGPGVVDGDRAGPLRRPRPGSRRHERAADAGPPVARTPKVTSAGVLGRSRITRPQPAVSSRRAAASLQLVGVGHHQGPVRAGRGSRVVDPVGGGDLDALGGEQGAERARAGGGGDRGSSACCRLAVPTTTRTQPPPGPRPAAARPASGAGATRRRRAHRVAAGSSAARSAWVGRRRHLLIQQHHLLVRRRSRPAGRRRPPR